MGILVKIYVPAAIVSVKKLSDMSDEEWGWRNDTVGRIGALGLYKSGQLYHIIHKTIFNELSTSKGVLKIEDNMLTLTTKNTEYVFEILEQYKL